MQLVVGIKFKEGGKVYFFNPNKLQINKGDDVIVETNSGLDYGFVQDAPYEIDNSKIVSPLKNVVRVATQKDKETYKENKEKEKTILVKAREIIEKFKINMPLTKVSLSFDGKNLLFVYTTDERVDFRELLKEFSATFKAKIEFKQIGSRDEAKMVGGLGPCGKECCCGQFLKDFPQTNIKQAKNQNIALNPSSINGLCGKLMCCLSYENEFYAEILKQMPKIGKKVKTPDGVGMAIYNDVFKKQVTVKFVDENNHSSTKDYNLEEINFERQSS